MKQFNIHEAKTRLSEIIREIEAHNTTVLICRNDVPVAEVRAINKSKDPLKLHPKLSKIIFHEDPTKPLSNEDWPEDNR